MTREDKFEGCERGFTHHSRSWYAGSVPLPKGVVDGVTFGFYHPEGGTAGEMEMKWHQLSSDKKPAARLEAFEDAWAALGRLADVVVSLAAVDGRDIQPDEFCALLLRHGFKDMTATERGEEAKP